MFTVEESGIDTLNHTYVGITMSEKLLIREKIQGYIHI